MEWKIIEKIKANWKMQDRIFIILMKSKHEFENSCEQLINESSRINIHQWQRNSLVYLQLDLRLKDNWGQEEALVASNHGLYTRPIADNEEDRIFKLE